MAETLIGKSIPIHWIMAITSVRCAECQCIKQDCINVNVQSCIVCTRDVCCCSGIHNNNNNNSSSSINVSSPMKKPLTMAKVIASYEIDVCCTSGSCENNKNKMKEEEDDALPGKLTTTRITPLSSSSASGLFLFLRQVKRLYAAALGIEIPCIAAAEIGENTSLYLFGFDLVGIPIAYAMGYALAGFATFVAILGRYNYTQSNNDKIDSCCSVLGQGAGSGFIPNLKATFKNFVVGITKLPHLYRQPNLKYVLKTSAFILVTAESACILTAETVDIVFYQYSIFLAVPLALLAGAFTVVAPEAYRKIKQKAA
jgi:hypothetical protein